MGLLMKAYEVTTIFRSFTYNSLGRPAPGGSLMDLLFGSAPGTERIPRGYRCVAMSADLTSQHAFRPL